jgi:hypothetical protein
VQRTSEQARSATHISDKGILVEGNARITRGHEGTKEGAARARGTRADTTK